MEGAGRGEVLGVRKAARPLLVVAEAAEPERLVRVAAVAAEQRHEAGVGLEAQRVAEPGRVEAEGRVLVMERVVVASREERADAQRVRAGAAPRVLAMMTMLRASMRRTRGEDGMTLAELLVSGNNPVRLSLYVVRSQTAPSPSYA